MPTLIKFESSSDRVEYSQRIMQRLGIDTDQYAILNVHSIGIDVPAKYVFEELLRWDGYSTCWPNHLAKVGRIDEKLDNIELYFMGKDKMPFGLPNTILGIKFIPLFYLKALKFQLTPDPYDFDNARFLLYKCTGGYPIGVFTMYVRSSVARREEKGQSQLFFMVGFNFYGKQAISKLRVVEKIWESIHDRVTANTMNRIKQLCEWRFQKIQNG